MLDAALEPHKVGSDYKDTEDGLLLGLISVATWTQELGSTLIHAAVAAGLSLAWVGVQ